MLLGAGLVSPFFPAATWFENVISFRARAIYWGDCGLWENLSG